MKKQAVSGIIATLLFLSMCTIVSSICPVTGSEAAGSLVLGRSTANLNELKPLTAGSASSGIVNFDDIPLPPNSFQQIIDYAGITWDFGLPDFHGGYDGGWWVYNDPTYAPPVSPPNYAFNGWGAINPGFTFASQVYFNGAYFVRPDSGANPSALRFVGYLSGVPTYYSSWMNLSDTPTYLNADFQAVDRVVVEMLGSGWFAMDDLSYGLMAGPSINIYTDKYTYRAGNTLYLGLDITNPDGAMTVCLAIWVLRPNNATYLYMHKHAQTLPAEFNYSNAAFRTIQLPNIQPGIYVWNAALLEPSTHSIIVRDTAEIEFI